uniref:PorV/PorQ family protein n=1 Tax=Pedobacter sp. TaxID=1411316 RepID=UPI003D7F8B64
GTKMSYTNGTVPYFLPANIKIGTAASFKLAGDSKLNLALDFNKLLVPVATAYGAENNDTSVPAGLIKSFIDDPDGLKDELKEISVGTGLEYAYKQQFALRAGYGYAHPQKGNKSYLTVGAGFKYEVMGLDLAYILSRPEKSPMANALRITLLFNFDRIAP